MSEIEMSIHDNLFERISFKHSKIKPCMINLPPTDEEIIGHLKSQADGLAFLTMIADKHWRSMAYSLLREKKCIDNIELSDIYAHGITTLYLNLFQERYQGGDLKSYFIGICKNTWFNRLRKKLKEPRIIHAEYDENIGSSDSENNSDRQEIIEKSLSEIGEPCRSIERFKLENYRLEEIGEKLGMTLRRVKENSKRCHDQFIKRLKGNGYGK